MLHLHSKDRLSLIFQMLQSDNYLLIFFNQHRNKNSLQLKKIKNPLLFHVCSPFQDPRAPRMIFWRGKLCHQCHTYHLTSPGFQGSLIEEQAQEQKYKNVLQKNFMSDLV